MSESFRSFARRSVGAARIGAAAFAASALFLTPSLAHAEPEVPSPVEPTIVAPVPQPAPAQQAPAPQVPVAPPAPAPVPVAPAPAPVVVPQAPPVPVAPQPAPVVVQPVPTSAPTAPVVVPQAPPSVQAPVAPPVTVAPRPAPQSTTVVPPPASTATQAPASSVPETSAPPASQQPVVPVTTVPTAAPTPPTSGAPVPPVGSIPSGTPVTTESSPIPSESVPSQSAVPGTPAPSTNAPSGPREIPQAVPLPVPQENHGPPKWERDTPKEAELVSVVEHRPPVRGDHNGPPPPVVGGVQVDNPWLHGSDQHRPPPNSDVYVRPGDDGQVTIINNVTQINNTQINYNSPTTVYLTNFNTGQVFTTQASYGTPWVLPQNWCGGVGGSWGFSANIGVPGAGLRFAGGGAFNVGNGCGYVQPVQQPQMIFYQQGYQPFFTNNYVALPNDCYYVNNTYVYAQPQQQPVYIGGQPQAVYAPTSYTPDRILQAPIQGAPKWLFPTGVNPDEAQASALATQLNTKRNLLLLVLVSGSAALVGGVMYSRRRHVDDSA